MHTILVTYGTSGTFMRLNMRLGLWKKSLIGGRAALQTFIIGMVMEFVFSAMIVATMIVSLATTG